MQASFLTDVLLPILTILAMLGLGISLRVDDFKHIFVRPKAIVVGLLNQLLFVPLTGILLALMLPLSPELAAGLIIIAASPGGIGSNITTFLLNGDSALSVSLTTVSNLFAFITLPLWTALGITLFFGTTGIASVSLGQIIGPVAVITLIPIGIGLLLRARWPQLGPTLKRPLRAGIAFLIVVAIIGTLLVEGENLLYYLTQTGVATGMLCLLTVSLGFAAARLAGLSLPIRKTIAIESGIQNVPLALTVTATILANPLIAITPAAYGLVQLMLFIIILVIAFGPRFLKHPLKQPVVGELDSG